MGIDSSTDNSKYLEDMVKSDITIANITVKVDFGLYDLVISTEVAEHIPKKYSEVFVNNLVRHAKRYIVFSASQPGQWGDGHINCQKKDFWINLFENKGAVFQKEMTFKYIEEIKNIEKIAKNLGWYENLMFFNIINEDDDKNIT
jgi:hypothetical protein